MGSPLFRRSNDRRREEQAAQQAARTGTPSQYGLRSLTSSIKSAVQKKLGNLGSLVSAFFKPLAQESDKAIAEAVEAELRQMGVVEAESRVVPARPDYRISTNPPPDPDDWRLFPVDEPILEGMIPVHSSNVHSIGYFHPGNHGGNGDLMVRFLAGTSQHRQGKGALYRYRDVPVSVWNSFKQSSSFGHAVWTDLRVLGTVSGHQYSFDLEEVGRNQTIPRQAGLKRGQAGEFFMPRQLGNRRSTLPERQVRGPRGSLPGWDRRSNLNLRAGDGRR